MIKKQVVFEGEKKRFSLGNGEYLTIKSGTILNSEHKLVKLFPSYCIDIYVEDEDTKETKEELLVEEPIECAVPEEVEEETNDEVMESKEITKEEELQSIDTKDGLMEFAAKYNLKINKRKSIDNIKKELLKQI